MSLADDIDLLYGNPMSVISDCLRSFIVSAPGKDLLVADFANIEGRGLAWLAGEEWKLEAFRDFDTFILDENGERIWVPEDKDWKRKRPDTYIQTYASAFGVPLFNKKDPRRQTGKTMELFSGYQGAHGAYLKGIKPKELPALARAVREAVPDAEWSIAELKFNGSHGLAKDQWTAIRILVDRWRQRHENIVHYWWDLEEAAIRAVEQPGKVFMAGASGREARYLKRGSFLFCRLPSGRKLAYPYACLKDVEMPWKDADGNKVFKPQLHYKTVDSVTRTWGETSTYGGKLCENCLSGSTEVLSSRGWVKLSSVAHSDLLWDGVEWCRHGGLIAKGEQVTISIDGVRMTPDHRVLTATGWQNASSCERLDRAAVALPHGGRSGRYVRDDASVSAAPQLAPLHVVHTAGRYEPVFDILNCGPRNRFVVRGGPQHAPMIVHNCTQAVCRDLLAAAMVRLEAAGYPVVMHVHDEIVAEVDEDFGDIDEFEELMCADPGWASGFPIAAEGWRGKRYRK